MTIVYKKKDKISNKNCLYFDLKMTLLLEQHVSGEMKFVAVIMDPFEVEKILRHLVKTGKSPPGINGDDLFR